MFECIFPFVLQNTFGVHVGLLFPVVFVIIAQYMYVYRKLDISYSQTPAIFKSWRIQNPVSNSFARGSAQEMNSKKH